ncbi:ATPase RavA domain-containing protein, partial [Vibrio genomosp. F10]
DSGLEALYDRMLVRVFINRIQNKQNFKSMLTVGTQQEAKIPEGLAITDEEYHKWQAEFDQLELSDSVFEKLFKLKSMVEGKDDAQEILTDTDSYVSDRRWKKAVRLLKASAFFNGRSSINPLDLLLLQDCLWNSPESRDNVRSIIRDFALHHAFDQQDVELQISMCREELEDIQTHIESTYSVVLSQDAPTGLLKKHVQHYDISSANSYQVGTTKGLVKLVLLQSNMSVSESDKGDSRWVYLPKNDLSKVIKEGGGEIYGYVNQNTNICRLTFDVDAENHLVIKDIANRGVLVALADKEGLDSSLYQQWSTKADEAMTQLQNADYHLRKVRSDFHGALPHSFIDTDLPTTMEVGLQELLTQLEATKVECEKTVFRVKHLDEFFA